ncbi:MAG: RsmB/NOP family class I SAM-dependent RNA methyltransferase [Candidatus Hermodarchaeota archaeon]|nr:RsmB/NOP family class I SAM-dependent RNA methyltransferase [Candidatus Hermodarchaeota archaeon]
MKTSASAHLAKKYGYLEYMVERYLQLFGADTEAFLIGNDTPLPKTLRVNTLVTSPKELVSRLNQKGVELEPVEGLPYAFRILQSPIPMGATTEYLQGWYLLQSPASMWAVEGLGPSADSVVIDMCAAPGGKTTLIAQLMNNKNVLLATDINRHRTRSLRSNLSRMQVENTLVMRTDATQLPDLGLQANTVLLDAPCTGEGLIPLDPSRKRSRTADDLAKLAQLQKQLLLAGIALLKEKGVLVYATCSFAPEENEEIIDFALQQSPIRIIDTGLPVGTPGFTSPFNKELDPSLRLAKRFYPYQHQMEGFFICKLEKLAA